MSLLNKIARALLIILLGFATLGFGLASLCGGFFTLEAVASKGRIQFAMLVFSISIAIVAGLLAWICAKSVITLSRLKNATNSALDSS
jgi:hypothetical protein